MFQTKNPRTPTLFPCRSSGRMFPSTVPPEFQKTALLLIPYGTNRPIRHPGNVGMTLEPTGKGSFVALSVQSTARGLLPQARSRKLFTSRLLSWLCAARYSSLSLHFLVLLKLLSIIVGNASPCQSFQAVFLTFPPACALLKQVCLPQFKKTRSLYP